MNRIIKLSMLLLLLSSFLNSNHHQSFSNDIKKWYEGHLEASDFTPVQSLPNNYMATSAITIKMDYNYKFSKSKSKCYAYSIFDRQASKISVSGNIKDLEKVIKHEQKHFDIAEYQTRLLNKAILKVEDWKLVDKIYLTYLNSLDSLQTLYDLETKYSLNEMAQKNWDKKIEDLMISVTE